MNRRDFLKGCGVLGAALSLGTFACAQQQKLTGLSVAQLRSALDQGQFSATELLNAFLKRVDELDSKLHSVIELNPDARSIAAAWTPEKGGLLGGIPVLLKDNIATGDKMVTSAGSAALADSRYPVDSGVAKRLREAGAVLMGKANMSEWANYRSDNSTSGWSARGGQCRNPHVLDRSSCGSSSGSAVAVAAALAPLAVGTETIGSIVCPSGTCGVVGLKPTFGLVPGDRIIPIATSWDTAGPMARSVADVAVLMSALAGGDYSSGLKAGALKGARLGVVRDYMGFDWRVDRLLETQLKVLEELGATIVDEIDVPGSKEFGEASALVMAYEFKAGVNEYLAGQDKTAEVRTVADVIAFNNDHPDLEALSYLGQRVLEKSQAVGDLKEDIYLDALAVVKEKATLEDVFEEERLDALLGPTNGPAWTIDFVNGDHFEGGSAAVAAIGGYPHITVPAGFIHELPVGLSFIGRKSSETQLLGLAYDYEQTTNHRRAPRLLESINSV